MLTMGKRIPFYEYDGIVNGIEVNPRDDSKLNNLICVKLPREDVELIRKVAAGKMTSVSGIARAAVDEYLRREVIDEASCLVNGEEYCGRIVYEVDECIQTRKNNDAIVFNVTDMCDYLLQQIANRDVRSKSSVVRIALFEYLHGHPAEDAGGSKKIQIALSDSLNGLLEVIAMQNGVSEVELIESVLSKYVVDEYLSNALKVEEDEE